MEFLSTIISEVGKCLYEPVKRHCGYLFCYARNVEKLSAEVTTLSTHKNDVDNKLEEERRTSQKEPLEAVKQWKEDVEKVARQANVYSGQLSGEQRPIQMGGCWCLNVITWRYKLGKDAAKEIVKVQELTNDLNNFHGDLTHCPPPSNIVIRRSDTIQNNESTTSVEGRVKQALGDDKCRSIGIYGMGGIGKTTLVEKINNDMTESNLFDKIIMVTVSQNPDLILIQEEIAGSLGILKHFKEEVKAEQHRASLLFNELKNWKRVLIILDDVWKELEMARVGIPIPRKDEHPCCKIIITTRDKDVCVRMRMEIKISVEPWSTEDSRKLFDSKVGQDLILKNPKLKPLANEIINECGGSPLAIVTLASALVGKDNEVIWKDALRSMRSSDPNELENIEGMVDTVIKSIKYSYNNLTGDHEGMNHLDSAKPNSMKLCFLFCSLFPEDCDINLFRLRTYGVGEGFLRVDGSLLDARDRLESYIERLKARHLLLDSSKENCVRMHDVVRDVARLIASKEHGFIGKAGIGLNEWPELHDAEDCKRMSLMNNDIRVLPADNHVNMPELRTLLLTGNRELRQIPDNFFAGMNKLVNLDLSETDISSVPPSISCLTSLRTLNIESNIRVCGEWESWDMSLIGKLKKLEILILGYEIHKVPNGLGELTNLKVLHLGHNLESIPKAVIPKLVLLQELCLKKSDSRGHSGRSATFAEVASLKHLTTLQLVVTRMGTLLSQDIPLCWKNNNFQQFFIGLSHRYYVPWIDIDLSSKFLLIENLSQPIKHWVLFLLQKTEILSVEKNKDFWYFPCLDIMDNLKCLRIYEWAAMKNVANIEEVPQATNNLGRLERLQLEELPSLERICQGPLKDGFFMNLKKLTVKKCEKIQSIMPLDLLQASQSLEVLDVQNCKSLTHVGSINLNQGLDEASIAENDPMPAMQALAPNLAVFLNLTTLRISRCHNLKYLFSLNMFQNGGFQQLQEINIFYCNNLKWIIVNEEYIEEGEEKGGEGFASLGVNEEKRILFPRLKALEVHRCAELISCVMTKKRDMDKLDDPLLAAILLWPKLEVLYLLKLPNLLCLYGEEGFASFLLRHPPLTNVIISKCPKLWTQNIDSSSLLGNSTLINLSSSQTSSTVGPVIFSLKKLEISDFDQTQQVFGFEEGICISLFHKLETLILRDLPRLESICTGYIPPGSFASLRYVEVSKCHSLSRCLQFSFIHAGRGMQHLESLEVESCEKLEKLITSPADEEGDQTVVVLPRLEKLKLVHVPELTSLYEGGDAFLRLPLLQYLHVDNCTKALVQPFRQADTRKGKIEEGDE